RNEQASEKHPHPCKPRKDGPPAKRGSFIASRQRRVGLLLGSNISHGWSDGQSHISGKGLAFQESTRSRLPQFCCFNSAFACNKRGLFPRPPRETTDCYRYYGSYYTSDASRD